MAAVLDGSGPPEGAAAGPGREAVALGRWRGLQFRFLATVIAGAVLSSVLVAGFAYRFAHQRAYAASLATLQSLAIAVERTVSVGAFAGDRVVLQEIADGLARHELVDGADVESAQGDTLAARWKDAHEAARHHADPHDLSIRRTLASPFPGGDPVGSLHLHADAGRIAAAATEEALRLSGLMVGQTALVALLLYAVAARLVSRPIVGLAQRLQAMSAGTDDRLTVPPRHCRDEIGVLIGSANALLDANAQALRRERELRAEIEAMETQYRQIFDSSSAGIFVLDAEGRMINGNPTVSRVVGLSLAEMRGLSHGTFLRRVFAQPEQVQAMIDAARGDGETVSADLELLGSRPGSRWVHCLVSVQRGPAALERRRQQGWIEGVIYDITERRTAEQAIRQEADHDALTGLKGRRASLAVIDRLVGAASDAGGTLSLLNVDLDGFKLVNDTLGHHAGDQVLVAVATRLKSAMRRASDLVGRLGGDEFVIVLPGVGPVDPVLVSVVQALLAAVDEPIVLEDGRQARIGLSIGIACLPQHGCTRQQLSAAADAAMYEVKRHGKNGWALAAAAAS